MGVAVILAATAPALAEEMPASLRELLIEYRCPVVDRLERVYEAGDHAKHADRFLAVTVPEHPFGYVQCMFLEKRTVILCEASSGYYATQQGAPRVRLPAEAITALAELGFDADDSKGNFQATATLSKTPPDFNYLADFILETLHAVYGARATSKLRFNAPFAPRATSQCVPVS